MSQRNKTAMRTQNMQQQEVTKLTKHTNRQRGLRRLVII